MKTEQALREFIASRVAQLPFSRRKRSGPWASYQMESLSTGGTPAGKLLSEEVPG